MAVFTTECIIKLMALQREYFQAGWNIFDIFIVGISYMDFIIETFLNLSVIRGMRLVQKITTIPTFLLFYLCFL
jgi:hypothetical protein